MKTLLTAETRPRMASGVSICTSVWRTTTLTLSRAPTRNIIASESQNERDRPKTIVAAPKPATAQSSVRPARRIGGRWASSIAMATAPTASAERRNPTPRAPTCRMSLAKNGQQVGRPAQQHGEQVERDRGQDELGLARRSGCPAATLCHEIDSAGARACRQRTPAIAASDSSRHAGDQGKRRGRVLQAHDQAADGRAGHRGDVKDRAVPGDGVGEHLGPDDLRQQGCPRGASQGLADRRRRPAQVEPADGGFVPRQRASGPAEAERGHGQT